MIVCTLVVMAKAFKKKTQCFHDVLNSRKMYPTICQSSIYRSISSAYSDLHLCPSPWCHEWTCQLLPNLDYLHKLLHCLQRFTFQSFSTNVPPFKTIVSFHPLLLFWKPIVFVITHSSHFSWGIVMQWALVAMLLAGFWWSLTLCQCLSCTYSERGKQLLWCMVLNLHHDASSVVFTDMWKSKSTSPLEG